MTFDSRYAVNPNRLDGRQDLFDRIAELESRIKQLEASLQIGFTAIETGELKVRNGNIVVVDTNNVPIMQITGFPLLPEILFWPAGDTDTHRVRIFALDFNPGGTIDQAWQVGIEETDGDIDGGKVLLTRNFAILSHQPDASGGLESYVWVNSNGLEDLAIQGKFYNKANLSRWAYFTGTTVVGSGFGAVVISYSTPFATAVAPVATLVDTGGAGDAWVISAYSTSSFTLDWAGSDAHDVHFWVARVG